LLPGQLPATATTHSPARESHTVPEFKEMTGLSRKYIIPLLEHFDGQKVTLRVGDKRVLRKK
jgi:selenocysteine-specific elongation factor